MNPTPLITLIVASLWALIRLAPAADTMIFPDAAWIEATPESQQLDSAKLRDAVAFLEANSGRDGARELVIIRNGRLIWKGDNIDNVHGIWSCTKSFTSTVLGLLIADGKCSLDTRVAGILPELQPHYGAVTLRHFTTMTSGYRADGDETNGGYTHGPSATPFKPNAAHLFAPGTAYAYWDSAMNELGLALTRLAGEPLHTFFKRRVADPIGMNASVWKWGHFGEVDGLVVHGGSGNHGRHVQISAREIARLGHLFLNEGRWNGRQLISAEWVRAATAVQVPETFINAWPRSGIAGPGHYGYNWWRNGAGPGGKLMWPGAPAGAFAALGHNNNKLIVIPEWQMVIVRLGLDEGEKKITDETVGGFLERIGNARLTPAPAAEHRVTSAADIARVAEGLQPGSVLVMADGPWADQKIIFRAKGTAEQPVTLRAETAGKVVLGGESSLVIEGAHLVVSGLHFKDSTAKGDGVKLAGEHCRLTETAVTGGACKFFVHVFGKENRVDHCYLADKTSDSPTMQIEVEGQPNRHRIDHNYFGPRPPLGRNGGETIRVGYSHQSMSSSGTIVEQNLFDRCDGEIEIISSKSCDNIYRGNTFLDCAGMLTLRHGNRCLVEGNFFLGHRKRGSGGIRVIGDDHTVISNYIDGVVEGAFRITSGIPDSPLKGYFQARRCLVAFNTVVDSRGPYIDVDAGIGTSGRTLRPEDITIACNIFALPKDGVLLKGKESATFKWTGNILTNDSPVFAHAGLRTVDAKLTKATDGLWRPAEKSAVRGPAEGEFPLLKTDIDGQPRNGRHDTGCDQISDAPVTSRPLTAKDTGPSWMERPPAGAK